MKLTLDSIKFIILVASGECQDVHIYPVVRNWRMCNYICVYFGNRSTYNPQHGASGSGCKMGEAVGVRNDVGLVCVHYTDYPN